MNLVEFLELAKEWEGFIGGIVGMFAGWFGQFTKARLQHERNIIDATSLENEQLRLALERERFLTDKLCECEKKYARLWDRFYEREEFLKHDQSSIHLDHQNVNEKVPQTVSKFNQSNSLRRITTKEICPLKKENVK